MTTCLPIPTGQPARDLLNLIWRKNAAYLDIGHFAMGGRLAMPHATVDNPPIRGRP